MKEITKNIVKMFLVNSDETGKHIVYSQRTGKRYFIEVIGGGHSAWGDLDPVTKKYTGNYGSKFTGSVKPKESVITEENGFKNIEIIEGGSPYGCIEQMDAKYPTIER